MTNQAGAVQSLSEYDAYGNEYPITTGAKNQFRFAGKHGYQFDNSTGLMLLGHRYYAAKLGRFLTQDPIGQEGGLNLYAYCSNNPLVNVDPDGQDWDSFYQGMSDFAAGWGDKLTGGLTKVARKYVGEAVGVGDANEAVNFDSGQYKVGGAFGTVHQAMLLKKLTIRTGPLIKLSGPEEVTRGMRGAVIGARMWRVEEAVRKSGGILEKIEDLSKYSKVKGWFVNLKWITQKSLSGNPVVDIGRQVGQPNRMWYNMERVVTRGIMW